MTTVANPLRFLILTFLPILCINSTGVAQSLKLDFLFRPGVTMGMDHYTPSSFRDSSKFSMNKYRFQATIPLRTKFNLNLNKLDVNASQTILTLNASSRTPQFENSSIESQNIYTFAAGITNLKVGLRNGLVLYSANVYVAENPNTLKSDPQINALGYVAKIKLNNLKFIYFYGLAAGYNYERPILLPLAGFTTRVAKDLRITAILPLQTTLTYKVDKKTKINLGTTISGFNSVYRDQSNELLNYRQLKNFISVDYKLSRKAKLHLEGGYATWRKMNFREGKNDLYDFKVNPGPYMSINLNYSIGKSLFGLQLDGMD